MLGRRRLVGQIGLGLALTGPAYAVTQKQPDVQNAIVETSRGRLRGVINGGIRTFKGIPYGASTDGPNRFTEAKPAVPVSYTHLDVYKRQHLGCSDSAGQLHDRLGVTIVRTLGEDGLEVANAESVETIPARAITAVDTTAAGDCFVGVLAAALDRGMTLPDALNRATAAAALCCTRRGSQGSIPSAAETDAFTRPSL